SGGEATRQQALIPAMRRVREMGFLIGLHTAGPYPHRLRDVLSEGLVDWVGIDVKAMPDTYQVVAGRQGAGTKAWEALDVLLEYAERRPGADSAGSAGDEGDDGARSRSVDYEVRLTVYPGYPGGVEGAFRVAASLHDAGVASLALQVARSLGAPEGFVADGDNWAVQVEQLEARIGQLGFASFLCR
ncbi:MAG: hypothetical protein KH813_06750, partial [Negativicoccus succinicivorans]